MKVTFRQSGGFAGLIRGAALDVDKLPAKEAKRLKELISRVDRKKAEAVGSGAPSRSAAAADVGGYEITIEDAAGTARLTLDDMTMTEELEPLVRFLSDRAKPVPPK